MRVSRFRALLRAMTFTGFAALAACSSVVRAEELVPGTGTKLTQVGDDFEDEKWEYYPNLPKSSENIDDVQRLPGGIAKNGRWYEGIMRGTPDVVKRVDTPEGGLEGSKGSLLMRSLHTGIPGRPSYDMQQDDFIADVADRLGGAIPVSQRPNVVVRVFLPPLSQWERRSGAHFAFRTAVDTHAWKREDGRRQFGREIYYPGLFVEFNPKEATGLKYDTAFLRVRAANNGGDYKGPQITTTGWWTMGMACTADGQIHYYAKAGIEDLTAEDKIASHYPYGYRCERFKTFFFNVCNADNGRTWSTPFIIDDPTLYFVEGPKMVRQPASTETKTR